MFGQAVDKAKWTVPLKGITSKFFHTFILKYILNENLYQCMVLCMIVGQFRRQDLIITYIIS